MSNLQKAIIGLVIVVFAATILRISTVQSVNPAVQAECVENKGEGATIKPSFLFFFKCVGATESKPATSSLTCYEDEVKATFAAGPKGRTDTMCIHYEELIPSAQEKVAARATAWLNK